MTNLLCELFPKVTRTLNMNLSDLRRRIIKSLLFNAGKYWLLWSSINKCERPLCKQVKYQCFESQAKDLSGQFMKWIFVEYLRLGGDEQNMSGKVVYTTKRFLQ
jgi:hypothetical protein